ncbi:MAG: hypothetical protein ACE5JU_24665 [Candidatus Binatia bacterium]
MSTVLPNLIQVIWNRNFAQFPIHRFPHINTGEINLIRIYPLDILSGMIWALGKEKQKIISFNVETPPNMLPEADLVEVDSAGSPQAQPRIVIIDVKEPKVISTASWTVRCSLSGVPLTELVVMLQIHHNPQRVVPSHVFHEMVYTMIVVTKVPEQYIDRICPIARATSAISINSVIDVEVSIDGG